MSEFDDGKATGPVGALVGLGQLAKALGARRSRRSSSCSTPATHVVVVLPGELREGIGAARSRLVTLSWRRLPGHRDGTGQWATEPVTEL